MDWGKTIDGEGEFSITPIKGTRVGELIWEYKDVFTWTYKDMKNIPLKLTKHWIELDTTIPLAHHTKHKLNPNYVVAVKQNINKLLITHFI